jgi:adenosylcobinamide-GDP ribazoletransferase
VGDGLRLALTTLTVARVRAPQSLDRATAGRAMVLAPLVGALLAAVLVPVALAVERSTSGPPLLAAALVIALSALLTRGLHLDGLADLADGLGSYRSPEQARAVMRAPDVGALGLAAVVLVLLVQVAALTACLSAGRGGTALLAALVTGRVAVAAACRVGVPAASSTGLGALVAGTVPTWAPPVLAVAAALLGAAALAVEQGDAGPRLALPAAAVAVALALAALLQRHAVRRLGGITGDVLGALVEVSTTAVLVVLALEL